MSLFQSGIDVTPYNQEITVLLVESVEKTLNELH